MTITIKKILRPFVPNSVITKLKKRREEKLVEEWKRNGCPVPPPDSIKQMVVAEYQNKYNYSVLVETGTSVGEMVEAQKNRFKKVFSIELGMELFERAVKRFRNDKNVTIVQGEREKCFLKYCQK